MSQEDPMEELQRKYAEVHVALQRYIGNADPRSYDKSVARMEESLMWAVKGIDNIRRGNGNGDNEQR